MTATMTRRKQETSALGGDVSNAGAATIELGSPFTVTAEVTGTSMMLFHRWQCDAVEAKGSAPKGSAAKKTDDVESYLWRDDNGLICVPGAYLVGAICNAKDGAAKYRQDPRSPRKSALDLFRAGVVSLTDLAPIITSKGKTATDPDHYDRRRAVVQRSGITRTRPAINKGWSTTIQLAVLLGQYIDSALLHDVLVDAGRLVGLADFRPTYGRFALTSYRVESALT